MKLEDQWDTLEAALPADWSEVHLRLRPEVADDSATVAATLGPMGVGRVGDEFAVVVRRSGGAAGPEAAGRLFRVLDDRRVWCELTPGETATATRATPAAAAPLGAAWDAALAAQPADWSDLLCRLSLGSSSLLDRAALLCAPINPHRDGDDVAFLFRAARTAGYGAAPAMVRRCFERLDAEEIDGSVTILAQLSELDTVGTQGAVL